MKLGNTAWTIILILMGVVSGMDMIRDIKDRIQFMVFNSGQLEDRVDEWWNRNGHNVHSMAEFSNRYENVPMLMTKESEKLEELFDQGRREMYAHYNELFNVKPIALTMNQIKQHDPPPNPAKITDPRSDKYIAEFGSVSWEVDALDPSTLNEIITKEIENILSMDLYDSVKYVEEAEKEVIRKIIEKTK